MTSKIKENLKELKLEDLQKKLSEISEEIRVLRFKAEGSKSKNVKEFSNLKKQIARILTKINESSKKL